MLTEEANETVWSSFRAQGTHGAARRGVVYGTTHFAPRDELDTRLQGRALYPDYSLNSIREG